MIESSLAESNLSETQSITLRIFKATFLENPALTVIAYYAPVEGNKDAENHFENLGAKAKAERINKLDHFNNLLGKETETDPK